MPIRLSKIIFIAIIGTFLTLVVFNNITDYWSNFEFVKHVLSMDTTFPDNAGMWRAMTSPTVHHIFYIGIILAEALAAFLCLKGAIGLFKSRNSVSEYKVKKTAAIYGLTLAILIWFVGFIAIGGEWFLMWQSKTWNGLQAAFRIVTICCLALIYLLMPDGE